MLTVKCIQKFRDKTGKIYGYRLQDQQGITRDIKSEEIKQAIRSNQIKVINLTLTSDNRLVDTTEKQQTQNNVSNIIGNNLNSILQYILNFSDNTTNDSNIFNLGYSNSSGLYLLDRVWFA